MEAAKPKSYLNSRSYMWTTIMVHVILPAYASIYFVISWFWDPRGVVNILGTISLFTLFLGLLLEASSKRYHDALAHEGQLVIRQDDGKKVFLLELNIDPDDLEHMRSVTFKITDEQDVTYTDD